MLRRYREIQRNILVISATLFLAPSAPAEEQWVAITSDGECPSQQAVTDALTPLLRYTKIGHAKVGGAHIATLADKDTHFSASIAGEERTFQDPAHNCEERARTAAVFIGLVLEPPTFSSEPTEEESAASVKQESAQEDSQEIHERPTPAGTHFFEAGAVARLSPEASLGGTPPLGIFGRIVRGKSLAFSAGARGYLPYDLEYEAAHVRTIRASLDAALRATTHLSRLSLGVEIGPEISLLSTKGLDVPNPQNELRLEPAARAAFIASRQLTKTVNALIGLEGSFVPRPHRYQLNPTGEIGRAPSVWLGALVGISAH